MLLDHVDIACPSKVNLTLSVGSPRPDGFHPIASWMVATRFGDQLAIKRLDEGPSRFDLSFAADAPGARRGSLPGAIPGVDWPLEKDLAWRAHALMEAHVGRDLPVHMTLSKRIPTGAGLGGGSSDAAGMLVGLKRLFALDLQRDELVSLARKLGSDVAFLVYAVEGSPSALAFGLGDQIEPKAMKGPVDLVLIFPGVGCPTAQVYKTFDRLDAGGQRNGLQEAKVRALAELYPVSAEELFNDLAEPACQVQPCLGELRGQLARELGQPVHVTGSGSTLFVVAAGADDAARIAQKAGKIAGVVALETRTI
ncbi:MAG: hypothetical protein IT443_08620 [Phycisphaeraceae bacterium]|nr:hypothetical protein [Phycisphaeraceae bacterium]